MIDASIALLKCVIDYGLCIWAFSWFAKRKSENRALFLGSIFLSSLFLFGINMLEIPWLNTIVSAFTLLVLFLVVFYTRWQQALPLRVDLSRVNSAKCSKLINCYLSLFINNKGLPIDTAAPSACRETRFIVQSWTGFLAYNSQIRIM